MDFLYRFRDWLSGPPAIAVIILILAFPLQRVMEKMAPKELFEIPLNLDEPPPPPPPPKPEIKPPEPVPPQPQQVQPVEKADVITPESVVIETKPPPPPPQETPKQVVEMPKVEIPAAPSGPSISSIQTGYEGKLKAYLNSVKRYPTSREARQQRPEGTVRIWFELNRDGSLKDTGVEKTSDSLILDQAALSTVRKGSYPPFPEETYPGETSHRFVTNLEYKLEQAN